MDRKVKKEYVEVIAKHSVEGEVTPLSLIFRDKNYTIDKVIAKSKGVSLLVGGVGIKYTIVVEGQTTYLFEEDGCWFVESKK